MAEDLMRYDLLAQEALRGVVRAALQRIARTGLPGDHHFYVAFKTHAAGVRISDRLMEKHPDEMTIVLQHQFWGLDVGDERFVVELSFDNIPEKLFVPFSAVSGFFDPSVQFGLQFEIADDSKNLESADAEDAEHADANSMKVDDQDSSRKAAVAHDSVTTSGGNDEGDAAEVVSLDAFRKK